MKNVDIVGLVFVASLVALVLIMEYKREIDCLEMGGTVSRVTNIAEFECVVKK